MESGPIKLKSKNKKYILIKLIVYTKSNSYDNIKLKNKMTY